MEISKLQLSAVMLFCLFMQLKEAISTKVNFIREEEIPGEYFPTCVEVTDVWPPPNSVLQPITGRLDQDSSHTHYMFRVKFSRPVIITYRDTTAGWNPDIAYKDIGTDYSTLLLSNLNSMSRVLHRLSVPPVFLSPSKTIKWQRFYPDVITNWNGSSKEYFLHFSINTESNLALAEKVYLVVDGGKFFNHDGKETIFVQTTIIGEYYFENFVKKNTWFKPKLAEIFQPSTYCEERHQRPLSVNQQSGQHSQSVTASLNEGKHVIQATNDNSISPKQTLNLSVIITGNGGTFSLKLPEVVNATYGKEIVSVKLPRGLTVSIKQPLRAPTLVVPITRVPVYELRERSHYGSRSLITSVWPKVLHAPFTWDNIEKAKGLFPSRRLTTSLPELPVVPQGSFRELVRILLDESGHLYYPTREDSNKFFPGHTHHSLDQSYWIHHRNTFGRQWKTPTKIWTKFPYGQQVYTNGLELFNVNMEVLDMGTGVKLAQWFMYPEFVQKENINQFYDNVWLKWSRDASIFSLPQSRYLPTLHNDVKLIESNHTFLDSYTKRCTDDSRRNQKGRKGGRIDHVIDYGPLYHLLEPKPPGNWWTWGQHLDITVINDEGSTIPASVISPVSGVDSSIPSNVYEAVQKYRCLLPPLHDVPNPSHPVDVNQKLVSLDSCIFVPVSEADSMKCGGLKLFKNISAIFDTPDFCNQPFGDCIGLPFTSVKRYPVIPTFGLEELTGSVTWPCTAEGCPIDPYVQHPIGKQFVDGKKTVAVPRSMLKFQQWRDAPPNMNNEAMVFSPSRSPDTAMEYNIILSGVQILTPLLTSQPPRETQGHTNTTLTPSDCDTVWTLNTEAVTINTTHPEEATLTATVYNNGQGRGTFVFDVQCTDTLNVLPDRGVTESIEAMGSVNVTFHLSALRVSSVPKVGHKCEMKILSIRNGVPVLQCSKWFETHFGAFQFPCDFQADLPDIDLIYYVLPASQYMPHVTQYDQLDVELRTHNEEEVALYKVITLSLIIPPGQEYKLKSLHQIRVFCVSKEVMPTLHSEIPSGDSFKHSIIIHHDLTSPHKVYFFVTKSWLASQSSSSPQTSQCKLLLTAFNPNWVCRRSVRVIEKMSIPLGAADVKELFAGPFSSLYPLFDRQSDVTMVMLILFLIIGLVCGLTVTVGSVVLWVYRSRLPKKDTLKCLQEDLTNAKREDKEYWENPVMYLCPNITGDSDSCGHYGETHYGPHFILHQWRATERLDTNNIKHLKLGGTVKYKTQELPVMFGHVKKIYCNKAEDNPIIWVRASSGMYLLPLQTVASDYMASIIEFYKAQGMEVEHLVESYNTENSEENTELQEKDDNDEEVEMKMDDSFDKELVKVDDDLVTRLDVKVNDKFAKEHVKVNEVQNPIVDTKNPLRVMDDLAELEDLYIDDSERAPLLQYAEGSP